MCYTKNKNNKIMDKRTFLKTGLLLGAGSLIAGPAIAGTKNLWLNQIQIMEMNSNKTS
jgi:hypothetical protein